MVVKRDPKVRQQLAADLEHDQTGTDQRLREQILQEDETDRKPTCLNIVRGRRLMYLRKSLKELDSKITLYI